MEKNHCIIIGAGHAGIQAGTLLREKGFDGKITLFSQDPDLPYQKPPLSKGFLTGKQTEENLWFRHSSFYTDQQIDLVLGKNIVDLKIASSEIRSEDGDVWRYSHLILATGARNRQLPFQATLGDRVHSLRTLGDAKALQQKLAISQNIALVGGGFIGLETAAAAREMGKDVTLFESGDRILARVLPAVLSDVFHQMHENKGVKIHLNARVTPEILQEFDLIVVGIGVLPNQELADAAGIICANGIQVNPFQQTSHPTVYAIGDCASHYNPYAEEQIRLESVQNAHDQAKIVVQYILGNEVPYQDVPWFWTHQYDLKLQMAGISAGFDRYELKGDPTQLKFSVYYYKNDRLIGVDSLNKPADHLQARKALAL